eukprot:ANDGO_02114.mRNA.1 TPR repeat-containing thioredoxin TTL1
MSRPISEEADRFRELGNNEYVRHNYASAIPLYTKAIALQPDYALLYLNRSAAHLMMKQYDDSLEDAKKAYDIDPKNAKIVARLGKIYVRIGEFGMARRILNSLPHVSSSDAAYAHLEESKSELEEAEKLTELLYNEYLRESEDSANFSRLMELSPRSSDAHVLYIQHLMNHFKLDAATIAVQELAALSRSPDISILTNKFHGLIQYQKGQFAQAIPFFSESIRRDPDQTDVAHKLKLSHKLGPIKDRGNAAFKAENWAEALAAYNEALLLDPTHPVFLSNRAAVYTKLGQLEDAMNDCNSAIQHFPHYAKAYSRRAYIYTARQEFEKAIADFNRAGGPELEDNIKAVEIEKRKANSQDFSDLLPKASLIHVADDAQFDQEVAAGGTKLVVVDMYADWCGPCKQIAPYFEKLSTEMGGKVQFLKVNVDHCQGTAAKFKVSSIPTFLFFKGGNLVDTLRGANPQALLAAIQKNSNVMF